MVYDPAGFEPLTEEPWQAARVRDGIRAIVADCDAAFDPDGLWPAHDWDGWQAALPLKNLYVGAAGVVWALHALRGHAEPRRTSTRSFCSPARSRSGGPARTVTRRAQASATAPQATAGRS